MEDGIKPDGKVDQNGKNPDDDISELWHEELERSYEILKTVIGSLPLERQKELIELLQIIAKGRAFQGTPFPLGKKAMQVVDTICKNDQTSPKFPWHGPEQRIRERRKGDRRHYAHNFGNPWSAEHIRLLQIMAGQNIPLRRIALRLGRTSAAVESKAKEQNIPLREV